MPANWLGCARTTLSKDSSAKFVSYSLQLVKALHKISSQMALKTLRDQRRDPRRTLPAHHKFSKHRFTIKEYGGKYFTCRSFGKSRRERFSLTKKTLQNFADNRLSLCTVIIKINNECRLE